MVAPNQGSPVFLLNSGAGYYAGDGSRGVDSLLGAYKWGAAPPGTPLTIEYSFAEPDSPWAAYSAEIQPAYGYGEFSAAMKAATRSILQRISNYANITFLEVDDDSGNVGTIRLGLTSYNTPTAKTYTVAPVYKSGDIWVNPSFINDANIDPGERGYASLGHEIGHALGLVHPHEGLFILDNTPGTGLDYRNYTNMSYNSVAGGNHSGLSQSVFPEGLSYLDVRALQYLYGANTAHNAGNTVYTWAPGETHIAPVWDGGGTDTFDLGNQPKRTGADVIDGVTGVAVDLNPGQWSRIGKSYTLGSSTHETRTVMIVDGTVIENVNGSAYDDSIIGNAAANQLRGNAGNDLLDGGDGRDYLSGGDGSDRLYGRAGNEELWAGNGDDEGWGGVGNDRIFGNNGDDALHGEEGDDHLDGGNGRDTLNGGDGRDQLFGGAGDDRLDGGAGDDKLDGGPGNDVLDGGAGNDTALFAGNVLAFAFDRQDTLLKVTETAIGHSDGIVFASTEFLSFGDRMLSTALFGAGTAGADAITGGSGHELMFGGEGNDQLRGNGGNDLLLGGGGRDFLSGGPGDDILFGAAGNDELWALHNNDIVFGGEGNDRIFGNDGEDALHGEAGDDLLNGSTGHDRLHGGAGRDELVGGDGDDALHGDAGSDRIDGGAGHDTAHFAFASTAATIARAADQVTVRHNATGDSDTLTGVEVVQFTDGPVNVALLV